MVSIAEATAIIEANLFKSKTRTLEITRIVGKVLAETVYADRDFPPFDRVAMDGIAINFGSWKNGQHEFLMEAMQAAGEPQKKLSDQKNCIEIMTGAVLPVGTDTVIRYEDVEIKNKHARVLQQEVIKGQNIHSRAQDATQGSILLEPGIILSPAEIALLASIGKSEVAVLEFPSTAIVSSGDELVDVSSMPQPHQIRRSNTYAVQAAMKTVGWDGIQYHLPDEWNMLKLSLTKIKSDHEVIILSGGVSKGKLDFIPQVLEEIGVKKLFHQVSQRPGKPFWFGVSADGIIVFALPGNPVSTYMCFYRYILPWLWKSFDAKKEQAYAILAEDFSFKPALTYFLQVRIQNEGGKLMAYPDKGGGSGDFANLKKVDGFLELPLEKSTFKAGEAFRLFSFRL
jgi:molybdopterin molybdotransferase